MLILAYASKCNASKVLKIIECLRIRGDKKNLEGFETDINRRVKCSNLYIIYFE